MKYRSCGKQRMERNGMESREMKKTERYIFTQRQLLSRQLRRRRYTNAYILCAKRKGKAMATEAVSRSSRITRELIRSVIYCGGGYAMAD